MARRQHQQNAFDKVTTTSGVYYDFTNTAPGTNGNQTINKPTGRVNIAAVGSTVTVTNNLVTAATNIWAQLATNDATATGIKCVIPAAGSFAITLNAASTGAVAIMWGIYGTT